MWLRVWQHGEETQDCTPVMCATGLHVAVSLRTSPQRGTQRGATFPRTPGNSLREWQTPSLVCLLRRLWAPVTDYNPLLVLAMGKLRAKHISINDTGCSRSAGRGAKYPKTLPCAPGSCGAGIRSGPSGAGRSAPRHRELDRGTWRLCGHESEVDVGFGLGLLQGIAAAVQE